ncbi:MAG: aminotransferase class III-fold pyridoxal phosphate-dependent enzyme, partial [Actinomycetota bacterium]|nr:aminotransferase class III-fold pyridoxal phosphate-dependent enzyme [Actinomycetota bacterium]
MWDIDGNEFIDCHAAFSAILLGHNHPVVRDAAIATLLERGAGLSCAHELEVELAYKLREHIPTAEMSAFSCTGSEATYHAIRLARAVTGRDKILKFEGCYHGWHDAVAFSSHFAPDSGSGPASEPVPIPASSGIAAGARDAVIVRSYNDVDGLETAIRRNGHELAAVIVEPVLVNGGLIEPTPEFLGALRELTSKAGVILIFDEVITGFRLGPGGSAARCGVNPDLTTLGKVIGGGLPVGAVCGAPELFDLMHSGAGGGSHESTGAMGKKEVVLGGTFSANPMTMSAGDAQLD